VPQQLIAIIIRRTAQAPIKPITQTGIGLSSEQSEKSFPRLKFSTVSPEQHPKESISNSEFNKQDKKNDESEPADDFGDDLVIYHISKKKLLKGSIYFIFSCFALTSLYFGHIHRHWIDTKARVLGSIPSIPNSQMSEIKERISTSNVVYEYYIGDWRIQARQQRNYLFDQLSILLGKKRYYEPGEIIPLKIKPTDPTKTRIEPMIFSWVFRRSFNIRMIQPTDEVLEPRLFLIIQ